VKPPGKKYNSLKPEKTPEKSLAEISKYEKNVTNMKSKKTDPNLNQINNKTLNIPQSIPIANSAVSQSKVKQVSPKVELTINSSKLDHRRTQETTVGTEKSTLVPMTSETTESSIYNASSIQPNQIYMNYNKGISKGPFHHKTSSSINTNFSMNQSRIKTSFSVEYTYKIIDLMDKMKNFLIISSQNQGMFFKNLESPYADMGLNIEIPFPTIGQSGGKHMKKNLSEDFDLLTNKLYLELNKNNDFLRNNKISRFYNEIDGIYKGSSELNDSVRNNLFSTIEISNESIRFESTRVNIESINESSDRMESLYHKLFNICKDCLIEIKSIIFENLDENSSQQGNSAVNKQISEDFNPVKKEDGNIGNIIKNNVLKNTKASTSNKENTAVNRSKEMNIQKPVEETKKVEKFKSADKLKTELPKKNEIKSAEKLKISNININEENKKREEKVRSDDKNKLINEKLEMLKHLKEKKEQILNQKSVKFDENTKIINKTGRFGNNTEIDPSELNENVITIQIPQSNICEVNKPVTDNNNFKVYTSEEEDGTFQGDSEIILHFDDFDVEGDVSREIIKSSLKNHKELDENIEKTLNDTVIETGNSFMKNHKRSRSQVIQKQLYTYTVKPQ
jgi:hypothetical protein